MSAISFVWDPRKNAGNKKKHGISFEEAISVFYDEHARVINDAAHSEAEDRFVILGFSSKSRPLVVVHCYKEPDELVRIISARKAIEQERKQYEGLRR